MGQERDVGKLPLLLVDSCLVQVVTPNLNTTTRKGKEQYCRLQQAQYSLSSTQISVPKAHRLARAQQTLDPNSL